MRRQSNQSEIVKLVKSGRDSFLRKTNQAITENDSQLSKDDQNYASYQVLEKPKIDIATSAMGYFSALPGDTPDIEKSMRESKRKKSP